MVNASVAQFSFSSGELSRKMRGRFDLPQYASGAERVENFITQTQGVATFRPGFKFVTPTKNSGVAALYSFSFNDEQSYVLEFSNLVIRIFTDEGILTEATQNITAITNANPAVVTITSHGYSNGDSVIIESVGGMIELNGLTFEIANVAANTFELVGIDSTSFGTYTSGGTAKKIVEVVSPYLTSQLFELQTAQNADTLYITHREHPPQKLTRTGPTTWTLTAHAPTGIVLTANNRPGAVTFYEQRLFYAGTNNDPQKLFGSKSGDFDDFTIGTGADDGLAYTIGSSDVNLIRFLTGTSRQMIVGTNGGTFTVRGGQGDEPITPTSISIKPTDGIGCENQKPILKNNRILFTQFGQRILRSFEYAIESDGYLSVDRNLISEDITLGGIKQLAYQEGRPEVVWCAKDNGELIGVTFKPEERVTGWHRHNGRTVDNFTSVATQPRAGQFDQLWVVVSRVVNGTTEHYVEFLEDHPDFPVFGDFFTGKDNKVADEAKFRNRLLEVQKDYIHIDSALTYDGTIFGTNASATLTPAATTGSAIVFTASNAVFDATMVGRELWRKSVTGDEIGRAKIVTFNSSTSVDADIKLDFDSTTAIPAGEWYLTTNSLSGLNHLNTEDVKVITDGAVHPDETVASNAITLDYQASKVHVGLGYTGVLRTMNIEVGGVNGPSQTKFKNIYRVGFKFLETIGVSFGTNIYRPEQILFRSTNSFLNSPPELFTGEKILAHSDSWKSAKNVTIIQNFALPATIQMIVGYSNTSVQ